MLRGFTYPLSPLGRASAADIPPWHYAADIIAFEFWADTSATARTLPPGLSPDPNSSGRVLALFADWQFTGQSDELLEPERFQYRGFHVLVDAHRNGKPVSWTPYTYVDNDAAMARDWILGCPTRLGQIFQTRSFVAPGPAAAVIESDTKFGASLSVSGQRLAHGQLTLRQQQADGYAILSRPIITRRYFPSLNVDHGDKASVDELALAAIDDLIIVDAWCGDAELAFPLVAGEELHGLSPAKMSKGYRFSLSCTIRGVVVLQDMIRQGAAASR